MNTFDTLDSRCRVCASELSDLTCSIPIFGDSSASFCLQTKILKFLYITVLEDDLLPKKICATCFLKIESIDKFAENANKNQQCFTTWLQNKQKNPDVPQTTIIETSTAPDFKFSNITIKKEFSQRQQIVFQPQKARNPRHVDHITLEQIINDQIIKNPKLPSSTTITKIDEPRSSKKQVQKSGESANNISIVSYHNLQIGQLIKDYELLKLILRALKWEEYDRKASYEELIDRLRRSNCRDILTNKNLLSDNDVVQLLRSYVNDSMLMNLKVASVQATPHRNISKLFQPAPVLLISPTVQPRIHMKPTTCAIKSVAVHQEDSVTNSEAMEVSVDPEVFLADEELITIEDDEETVSAAEAKIETTKLETLHESCKSVAGDKPPVEKKVTFQDLQVESKATDTKVSFVCSSCPESFESNAELQSHAATHLITSTSSATSTKSSAIEGPLKLKKVREMLRSKRKKIVIRINPSPAKRNSRDKAKVVPKFACAICHKNLSSKRNVQLHQETHRDPNGKFKCDADGCKKLFIKLENLIKHSATHEKRGRKKHQNEK